MSMSYDERIGYAQKGEPEAICGLVFYCMYDHEDDMFEKRENEAKYWAKQLKALAVSGNLVAQEMIINCRSDFAKEVLCTGESVLEIQKLQQQYMDHIFFTGRIWKCRCDCIKITPYFWTGCGDEKSRTS